MVFLGKLLCLGHGFENIQTVRHPVTSRAPIVVAHIICAPVTAKGGHALRDFFAPTAIKLLILFSLRGSRQLKL